MENRMKMNTIRERAGRAVILPLGIGAITSFLSMGIGFAATPVAGEPNAVVSEGTPDWGFVRKTAEKVDLDILRPYMDESILGSMQQSDSDIAGFLSAYCEADPSFIQVINGYFVKKS